MTAVVAAASTTTAASGASAFEAAAIGLGTRLIDIQCAAA